jgi:single-strand DNA-binding protein
MFNQIILVGNLGNDPEMRYTPNGVPVTSFSLAVSKRWTSQDGQKQEKTTWYRINAWRKEAELASQYLTKGRQVMVVGELDEARMFTGRDGQVHVSLEVTAHTIRFLGGRGESAGGADVGSAHAAPAANAGGEPQISDEDIPF